MRKISNNLRNELANDPYYSRCARWVDGGCKGRITWEHAIIYAGKQLNEKWAIIPLCEYHHSVNRYQDTGDLDKEKNICIALMRAPDERLKELSKAINYLQKKEYCIKKYGLELMLKYASGKK